MPQCVFGTLGGGLHVAYVPLGWNFRNSLGRGFLNSECNFLSVLGLQLIGKSHLRVVLGD